MLKAGPLSRLVLVAALTLSVPFAAHAVTVKIGGTGAALGTMTRLGEAFAKAHSGTTVLVLPSLGSGGGIKALRAGAVDIAVSARPLKDKEKGPGISASAYGRTAIVFATAADVGKADLTTAEVVAIHAGTLTRWPNGQDIRIVLRPKVETDTKLMVKYLPGMGAALDAARKRETVPVLYTDQKTADAIAHIPGALGPTTLALNVSERRGFHVFSLNGVAPTPETIADGRYPMVKTFYLVTGPATGPTARQFVAFVHSADGAAMLRRLGHQVVGAPAPR